MTHLHLTSSVLAGFGILLGYVIYRRIFRPSHYTTAAEHRERLNRVIASLRTRPPGAKLSLHRRSLQSNTIRNASHKGQVEYHPVDLSDFTHIIEIDANTDGTRTFRSITTSSNDGMKVEGQEQEGEPECCGHVLVEPGITFGTLLSELLPLGLAPMVIIEFPEITIGGAISGGGLESASHKYGQFMDTVLEIECLTPMAGDGSEVTVCSPERNADLFYALSASYNTVGLVTAVKIKVRRASRFVRLSVERWGNWEHAVAALAGDQSKDGDGVMASASASPSHCDTLEGIAFAKDDIVVIRGQYTDEVDGDVHRFSRHWDRWYYKVIHHVSRRISSSSSSSSGGSSTNANNDILTHSGSNTNTNEGKAHHSQALRHTSPTFTVPFSDYCFRYNHGAFWMAAFIPDLLLGDNFLTRVLFGWLLDTRHLFAVLHSSKLEDLGRMRIIQDCYIPHSQAVRFLEWEEEELGVWPLWLCPVKGTGTPQFLACNYSCGGVEASNTHQSTGSFGAQTNDGKGIATPGMEGVPDTKPGKVFINVGIYGRPRQFPFDAPRLNHALVEALIKHNGRSMLYAQNWHSAEQFDAIYGDALRRVDEVKRRYRGGDERQDQKDDCFYELYEKVALKEREKEEMGVHIIECDAARGGPEAMERDVYWRVFKDVMLSKLRWR